MNKRSSRIQRLELWRGQVAAPVTGEHRVRDSLLLRLGGGENAAPTHGLFFVLQNPFSQIKRTPERCSIAYGPDVSWKSKDPYLSDRLLMGPYALSGARFPAQMEPEWNWVPLGNALARRLGGCRGDGGPGRVRTGVPPVEARALGAGPHRLV